MNANTLCESKLTVSVSHVDGTFTDHDYPENALDWQALVKGCADVYVENGFVAVFNNELERSHTTFNKEASRLVQSSLYGPVVIVSGDAYRQWMREERGEIIAL